MRLSHVSLCIVVIADSNLHSHLFIYQAHEEHCLAYGDRSMSCKAMANLCRSLIAEKLRTSTPLNVDVLLAG